MANIKISELDAGTAPTGAELVEAVQGASSVSLTLAQLAALSVTSGSGAPAHTPVVGAQTYFDEATGDEWHWYGGAWH